MDKVVIRPAAAGDIDAIARLWLALVEFHREIDGDLPAAAPNGALRYARRLIDRVEDSQSRVLVAEADGHVVGYVLGMVVDLVPEMFAQPPSGFLADIFVDAEHRRQGVGRALVDALAAWFREHGLDYYEWHVAARNTAAVEFWRAVGGRDVMLRMRGEIEKQ
ncbi:MAG: GNAT family N-acetyltransferase [Anaerolinea sp.]|nr:GNAT family N-acetyltransferase [Anaerolinea sp.]